MGSILEAAVLVLNLDYEPLIVATVRRAIIMIVTGKAEIVANGRGFIRTPTAEYLCPSVIRLDYLIRRPRPRVRLARREVFRRDNYTCQYCGIKTRSLTVDHVIPKHGGGEATWENLASACRACNRRKGGKTLAEANMTLLRKPYEPRPTSSYLFGSQAREHEEWQKFLQGW